MRNMRRFNRYYDAPRPLDFHQFGEFRAEKFPATEPQCWLDREGAAAEIERRVASGKISEVEAEACRFWADNGYLILPGLIPRDKTNGAWTAYEEALDAGLFGPPRYIDEHQELRDRILDPHLQVPQIKNLQADPTLLRWTDLLLGRASIPFQTIIGHAGSQQAAHSDSIHMTTYPLGFLCAAWIAFEDIGPDAGPLEFYPRSHRLPYIFSADISIAPYEFKQKGYAFLNERYDPVVAAACERAGLKKETFLAAQGDVLLWHANLVHAGARRNNPSLSRKALVCHYFAERTVTYHDLSGNASRLHSDGMYAPIHR